LEAWWLSCRTFTACVIVDKDGRIAATEQAPIIRRWIGRPAKTLGAYMKRQGNFHAKRLV